MKIATKCGSENSTGTKIINRSYQEQFFFVCLKTFLVDKTTLNKKFILGWLPLRSSSWNYFACLSDYSIEEG